MACQTLPIIGGILANDILVRIVASDAADAGVGAIEALAVGESVRLEANGEFASPVIPNHRLPRAMALAAEVGDVLGGPFAQIGWRRSEIVIERIAQVGCGSHVTVLAGYAWAQALICH